MSNPPIWAILYSCNDADFVFAAVSNAFAQGVERVLLVDGGSTDGTLLEARRAGAEIALTVGVSGEDDIRRVRVMNDLVQYESDSSQHDAIWWLWLECDGFPCGPDGERLADVLSRVHSVHRILGANGFLHTPRSWPRYLRRYHPWDFMPDYERLEFATEFCRNGHWQHPLQKYVRGRPSIRAKAGLHEAICAEPLSEPEEGIEVHLFPRPDRRSPSHDGPFSLDSSNDRVASRERRRLGIVRWYPAEEVPDPELFADLATTVLLAGDEEATYRGLILASVIADLGASVRLVSDRPDGLDDIRGLTGTGSLPLVPPGVDAGGSLVVVVEHTTWTSAEIHRLCAASPAPVIVTLTGHNGRHTSPVDAALTLDAGLLPAAKGLPPLRPLPEREELILVAGSLKEPNCRNALERLLRPEFGGLSFGLLHSIATCSEDELLPLVDAADAAGIRLSDQSGIGPVARAEMLSRAKAFLALGDQCDQALRDGSRMGLPILRVPPYGPLEGTTARGRPISEDRLALEILSAIESGRAEKSDHQDIVGRAGLTTAVEMIGNRLAASLSAFPHPPRSIVQKDSSTRPESGGAPEGGGSARNPNQGSKGALFRLISGVLRKRSR